MSKSLKNTRGRRKFLKDSCTAALGVTCFSVGLKAGAGQNPPPEDRPNTHNMLVVGEKTVFLSHLPMFDSVNDQGNQFTSPHRYQVILEATFTKGGKNLQALYASDRRNNPRTRMYTLQPELFVLPRLFTPPAPQKPLLSSFKGKVFHGHLEREGNRIIAGLENVDVNVKKVVHSRQFDPRVNKPLQLEYFLFGKGQELFLAHLITKPPDFDQILSVKVVGREFTDNELSRGVRVTIPDRKNVFLERVKEKQQVSGEMRIAGAQTSKIQIQAGTEFYFEEGELRE